MAELVIYKSYKELELDGKINIPSIQRDIIPNQIRNMIEHIKERYIKGKEPIFGNIDFIKLDNKKKGRSTIS